MKRNMRVSSGGSRVIHMHKQSVAAIGALGSHAAISLVRIRSAGPRTL